MNQFDKLMKKLQEPSTIKGIIVILGLAGIQLSPEQQNEILVSAGAFYSIIQIFWEKD